jgi:hypothetical protein
MNPQTETDPIIEEALVKAKFRTPELKMCIECGKYTCVKADVSYEGTPIKKGDLFTLDFSEPIEIDDLIGTLTIDGKRESGYYQGICEGNYVLTAGATSSRIPVDELARKAKIIRIIHNL